MFQFRLLPRLASRDAEARWVIFCSVGLIVIIFISVYVTIVLSVRLLWADRLVYLATVAVASISKSRSSRQISAMAVRFGQAKSLNSLQKIFSTSAFLQYAVA